MKNSEQEFLHDLASPLAGIELILETVINDISPLEDSSVQERLQEVLRGVDRIRHLLDDRRQKVRE